MPITGRRRHHPSRFSAIGLTATLGAVTWQASGTAQTVAAPATPLPKSTLAGPAGDPRVIGLAVSTFRFAHNAGRDDCPAGLSPFITHQYLKTLPEAERARLSAPERDPELNLRATSLPDGADTTSSPAVALARSPGYHSLHQVQSKRSWGLDLDKDMPKDKVCPHQAFIGMDGEKGVDNQFYRAMGCTKGYRWDKAAGESVSDPFDNVDLSGSNSNGFRDGQMTILIEISEVDDPRNDPSVKVGIYSGRNPMTLNARAQMTPYTSHSIDPNPRWHNETRGRIVNGVLETDPFELRLKQSEVSALSEYVLRHAKLRIALNGDGAKGILAGYTPISSIYWPIPATYRSAYARNIKEDNPASYRTLYELADGYPDPETGQCTAISMARAVTAVPAFIVRSAPVDKAADATPQKVGG